MKILAIRLKNLTSIEGAVEVDFAMEPLNSAGIFAISGATGAGKSTLLDALCLALYDKAPRFANSVESINLADVGDNQINQSDVRNLLRRGTTDGYAEVDFLGVDGHRYRSRWSVRRTRNKVSGSLQPQTMEVKELDTGKEFQGTKKELLAQLTELVGLTYEQFTRTVLLAQNDFSTFLKSKGAAKAELLEKLTGTGVYSRISQEVFLRNKLVQEEVTTIRNRMSVIDLLPEEELLALQKEKELLIAKRAVGIQLLAEQNARLNIVRSLKMQEELWKKKQQEEQGEEAKLRLLQETLASQEEGLVRFKAQWEAIQPDLKKARQLDVQIQSQQEGYNQLRQILETACGQVAEQEKKMRMATKQLQGAYRSLNRLLTNTETESLPLEQVEDILQQEEDKLKAAIKANEERLVRLNAFDYVSLDEEQKKLQKELVRQQNVRQLTESQEKVKTEIVRLEKETVDCSMQLTEQEATRKTIQRLYENARMAVGKDVKALRQQLQEGEACPVCGSTSHPYHREQEVVDILFRNIEQEYNAVVIACQQTNNQHIALQRDLAHQKTVAGQIKEQLSIWQKEEIHAGNEEQIQNRLQELAKRIQEYSSLYTEWQRNDEAIKKIRVHCEALRENVSQCRLQEFHRPHHGAVHHAGGDPGQAAVGNPDKGNDRGAHQPDEDGSPAAVPDDRVNVPPQRVRAEPEFGIGSRIDVHEEEFGGIMVDDQVGKKAAEGDHGKHGDGEGGLAFQSRPEAFFPYGGLVRPVPGPDDREGIVGRGVHQHTTPSEDFMRGSMTSLTACATRLLSMTIPPVISTMSISRL